MVEEYDLCVVVALYFDALGAVARWVHIWVYVNDLPVPLVPEEESLVVMGIHTEIR